MRQERCVSGQTQTLTTVCKPDGRASQSPHEPQTAVTRSDSKGECQHFAAKANLLGFATLLVTRPARFAAQSGVDRALGSALAQLVPSSASRLDENQEEISRRLQVDTN